MKCEYCGRNEKNLVPKYRGEYGQYLCWNCYTHYKEHPVNPLPPKGEIRYDDEGRVICHICGRAYDRLSTHIRYKHDCEVYDYKEEFGLNRTQRLTSETHREKLRNNIPRKSMEEIRVLQTGGNKGKKNRLQAKINREKKRSK